MQGPRNFCSLLGSDVDALMRTQTQNNCEKCSNSFFAVSSQHVTVMNIYSSMNTAIIQLLLEHCDFLNIDISQGSVEIFKVWWNI